SWNPAGLSYLRRPELSFVWTPRNSLGSVERTPDGVVGETDDRRGSGPDFFALTFPFERKSVTGAAQLSFQRVISFSSSCQIVRPPLLEVPAQTRSVESGGGFD